MVGMHARPSLDDYSFSAASSMRPSAQLPREHYIQRSVRYAVTNGNILDIIGAVGNTVADNYREWQGTFSAIALFSAHPGVLFGPGAYPLTMLLTIFSLIVSTAFLCRTLLGKNWLLPGIIILTASIQWLPHIAQGFFWYNGAVFYTFFYSLMLFSLALKIRIIKSAEPPVPLKIALVFLLDFFIGGGNYVTALLNTEINIVLTAYVLWQNKNDLRNNIRKWIGPVLFTFASLSGLLVSALAPGNAFRAALFTYSTFSIIAIPRTVFLSIGLSVWDVINWTTPAILILLAMSIPLMWRIVRDIKFDFKYPLIVSIFTFLLFASQNAPPIFAMDGPGDPKLRNIVYFSYIWLVFGNAFYWTGWVSRKIEIRSPLKKAYTYLLYSGLSAALLVLGLGFGMSPINRAIIIDPNLAATTALTTRDLHAGLPQQFLVEYEQRRQTLENSTEDHVVVVPFTAMPLTLVPFYPVYLESSYTPAEITHSPTHWINRSIADYYGRVSVVSRPPQRTVAISRPVTIWQDGRSFAVDSFLINESRYFRLKDMAYILDFGFDFYQGEFFLDRYRSYTPAGSELRAIVPRNEILPAYLHNETLTINGIERPIFGYIILGEVYFIEDLPSWVDARLDFN